jgi:hypothetical protein
MMNWKGSERVRGPSNRGDTQFLEQAVEHEDRTHPSRDENPVPFLFNSGAQRIHQPVPSILTLLVTCCVSLYACADMPRNCLGTDVCCCTFPHLCVYVCVRACVRQLSGWSRCGYYRQCVTPSLFGGTGGHTRIMRAKV